MYMVDMFRIPPHNYSERESTVVNTLKKHDDLKIKSFLNVGFHNWEDIRRHWWIRVCEENNIDWKILEIFKPNVEKAIVRGCPTENIIHGNILDVDTYEDVDCLMFWHGPEHIEKEEFLEKLLEIEKKAKKIIIFGMPLGDEPQDIAYGNEHEIHVSAWYSTDWKKLGYETIEVHDRPQYNHITAYKIIS